MSTDLHFCNFCQQSVPQDRIETGDAIKHGGRVVCPTCCDTLVLATASRQEEVKPVSLVVPLVVGFVGWGAALFAWFSHDQYRRSHANEERIARENTDNAITSLHEGLNVAKADILANRTAQGEADAEVAGQLAAMEQAADERHHALEEALAPLPDLVAVSDKSVERLAALETNAGLIEESLRETRTQQEFLRDRLDDVERTAAAAVPQAAEGDGFPTEIQALIEKLDAEDPLDRAEGLEAIAKHDDPRLAPFVEPLLADSYEMNRFYAAYALGEMGEVKVCGSLVDSLDDDYSFVRKAAFEALQKLSGEDIGFDHQASAEDRKSAVDEWRAWWTAKEAEMAGAPAEAPAGG